MSAFKKGPALKKKLFKKLTGLQFSSKIENTALEASHLIFRAGFACLIMTHGWGKLMRYPKIMESGSFPDPIGLGPQMSLTLAVGAEFFAALLLALGLFTRLSSLSLFITMCIIAFVFHGPDPFQKKELAVLYGLAFLVLMISGGKKYSLDAFLRSRL